MVLRLDTDNKLKIHEEKLQKKEKKQENKLYQSISIATQLGYSVSLPIVGGAFLGSFLDNKFNSAPKLTLSFIFFGLVVSGYSVYKMIKKLDNK